MLCFLLFLDPKVVASHHVSQQNFSKYFVLFSEPHIPSISLFDLNTVIIFIGHRILYGAKIRQLVRAVSGLHNTRLTNISIYIKNNTDRRENSLTSYFISGFGGLEVACWLLVPKFTGSNPAEAVGFFRTKKSSARLPSEGK